MGSAGSAQGNHEESSSISKVQAGQLSTRDPEQIVLRTILDNLTTGVYTDLKRQDHDANTTNQPTNRTETMTNATDTALANATAGLTTTGEAKRTGDRSTQRKIEQDMAKATSDKFYADLDKARSEGNMDETKPGRHILAATVGDMADRIQADLDKVAGGQPKVGIRIMREFSIDSKTAAYLTLKSLLGMDSTKGTPTLTDVAATLGQSLHQDSEFKRFGAKHKEAMKQLQNQWKQRGTNNEATKKHQIRAKARREAFGIEALDNPRAIALGTYLFEKAAEAGYAEHFEVEDGKGGKSAASWRVKPSEQFIEFLGDLTERAELLEPRYWPTVTAPRHWDDVWSGGYHTDAVRRLPLIKRPRKGQFAALESADLTQVTDATNAMQDTPWQVNSQVLAVYQWALGKTEGVAGLPPAEDMELPPKPADFDALIEADKNDPEVRKWKRSAAIVHEANAKLRSKRLQALAVQRMAEQFEQYTTIFFPYNLDFRGRAYAVPMHLNPQGSDHAKALLKFSKGERMGDSDSAEYWLAVHGANVYGNDKAGMADRAASTRALTDEIVATAADPYGNLDFWTEADKPWQFLAFCFEWAGYQEQGADFVATLPVAMDGSCNGLQHYSAAIRDQVGGEQVNLVPSDMPQDIYSTVAEGMRVQLAEIEAPSVDSFPIDPDTGIVGPLDDEQAKAYATAQLKSFKIDRKLAKQTVMTVPYGVTEFGAYDQLSESLAAALGDSDSPFKHLHDWGNGRVSEQDGIWNAARVLAPMLMDAIGEALAGAQQCMDFVKDTVKVANDAKLATTWTTPDGFPVVQSYVKTEDCRVGTTILGDRVRLKTKAHTDKLDSRKAKTAAPPNFVHSLDATAMRMYVNLAKAEGINHFAMVHDSFGTVATKVESMNRLIRSAFVSMYGEHDVLANFSADVAKLVPADMHSDLPPVPAKGNLDLDQVHQSDYFFS